MIPVSSSLNENVPRFGPICFPVLNTTRTGNVSGNLKLAHLRSRLNKGLRQSHNIGQPHHY